MTEEATPRSDARVTVRALRATDRPAWDELWAGYQEFYEVSLAPEVTETAWARFFDPAEAFHAIVASLAPADGLAAGAPIGTEGPVVGICHYLFHRSTWATTSYCYLEDLFTAPSARNAGVGLALIEATATHARAEGADKLYWQTHQSNAVGRALYDRVAENLGFIVYERRP